jgi:acetylornithine/LysW-gamma-L-lysine aminotransferase
MKDQEINYKEMEDRYEMGTYPKRDIVLVSGEGATVIDNNGKTYIDCTAGVGVANIGHSNPDIIEAISKQGEKLITCYSIFYSDQRARLLKKLVEMAPESIAKAFLCNSGTEAIEAAIKFSRSTTGKQEIITLKRSYHGKTMGALSATWGEEYREPFEPLLSGIKHVPPDDLSKLEETMTDNSAALMVELIQGEGGVRPLDKSYIQEARKKTEESGILLIIDEVQTGFGRTGAMFACEQYEVQPDILCCAKAMAGGIPMGATLCAAHVTAPKKSHTTTFGGSPLACAASLATIEYIEKHNLLKKASENGKYFIDKLKLIDSPKIREVRGLGLMIGVELKRRAASYVKKMAEKGILALLAGSTVIRFLPPLVISKEQIDKVVEAFSAAISSD